MVIAHQSLGNADSCNFQARSKPAVAVWRRAAALSVSLIAASASMSATAAEERPFQVTPFGSYATGDKFENSAGDKRDVDDTGGWGLVLDLEQEVSRYYELIYASFSTESEGDTAPIDMDIQYLQIGGTVAWADAERVIPYFGMTIGAAHLDPDLNGLDSATKFAFTIGAGIRVPISDRIGVRAEWRSYLTVLGSDSNLFCASAGGAATCALRSHGDIFAQHSAQLGVVIGF
ncbi:MAG: outer membrane beta-barrel protein [Steroidobacteraceae bacterium]